MTPRWNFTEGAVPFASLPVSLSTINTWGGVDLNDQLLQPYLSTRKSLFWYKKVAIYFFHLALLNSFIIYQKSTETPTTFIKFIEDIVTALIYHQVSQPESIRSDSVSRLHERHFPDHIPPTESGRRQKNVGCAPKKELGKIPASIVPTVPPNLAFASENASGDIKLWKTISPYF